MTWIQKLERRFGKYAVNNLMIYMIIIYVIGFLIVNLAPQIYYDLFSMNPAAIMQGQVWRLITFILFPPSTNFLYFLIYMYMYYLLGSTLERIWGPFTFNLYIFIGIIGHIIAAMAVYWVTGINVSWTYSLTYLYLSLFLAFALTFPDAQFLLFFFIPIKAKWIAIIDAAYFLFIFISGGLTTRIVIVISLLNFLLFFLSMQGRNLKNRSRQNAYRKAAAPFGESAYSGGRAKKVSFSHSEPVVIRHRCSVCGITDRDDPNMDFRYCSHCDGQYEYCMDHLYTHVHVKNNT